MSEECKVPIETRDEDGNVIETSRRRYSTRQQMFDDMLAHGDTHLCEPLEQFVEDFLREMGDAEGLSNLLNTGQAEGLLEIYPQDGQLVLRWTEKAIKLFAKCDQN